MKNSLLTALTVALCCYSPKPVAAQLTTPTTCQPLQYSINEIVGPRNLSSEVFTPSQVNRSQFVVGSSGDFKPIAVLWSARSGAIDLSIRLKNPLASEANAINRANDIIGTAYPTGDLNKGNGFYLKANGTLSHVIYRGENSKILAINDKGLAVGYSTPESLLAFSHNASHAFMYNGVKIKDLGTLNGEASKAIDVNNLGSVLGVTTSSRGFLWKPNVGMIDITRQSGNLFSAPVAINDYDEIVGNYALATQIGLRQQDGSVKNLGGFPGFTFSSPTDINNQGNIVGHGLSIDANAPQNAAFIWRKACGRFENLYSAIPAKSGWQLLTAQSINDSNVIVGTGILNGMYRGYLMKPKTQTTKLGQ